MIVIAGLGNPEKDYKGTRHNVGFEAVNKFAYDHNIDINRAKFRAHLGEGHFKGEKILLVKPQTYMNLSGESVRDVLSFYKLSPENLIVLFDDTDLDVGEIRIRKGGTSGGQKGMKSIIYQLETDEITRIRIGIGQKPKEMDLAAFVLSRFHGNDMEKIIEGITKATDALEIILKEGVDAAMNKYNKKKKPEKEEPPQEKSSPKHKEVFCEDE